MVEHLILQLLTILIPIVVVQAFMLDRFSYRRSWKFQCIVGGLSGLSAIVCMTFPVQMGSGFIWDYRWIPQTLAILYGGYGAGAIAFVMSTAYRAFLGGDAATLALVGNSLYAIIPFIFGRGFLRKSRKQRYIVGIELSFASFAYVVVAMAVYWSQLGKLNQIPSIGAFIALTGVIQLLLTAICMFVIEKAIEVSRVREHIHRSEQMSVVSQLAASVAHEVRNPLTTIRGFLQLTQAVADPKVKSYMSVSLEELDRAEAIISDYLNFAKPLAERMETVNMTELMNNAAVLMSSYATMHKVDLTADLQPGMQVFADRAKLSQVVMNIVKNAIEAAPGGSVAVSAYVHGNEIVIRVKDTGIGMSSDELKRLGSPFFTTKANGTGLGLTVSFRLIEAMQGKLAYESAQGAGTTAVIRLPAVEAQPAVKLSIVKNQSP